MTHRYAWLIAVFLGAVLLAGPTAEAAAPALVPLHGTLTDPSGAPIDGPVTIMFTIYTDASGATVVWSEEQALTVEEGAFTAYLGSAVAIDLALFKEYSELYLGVAVESDSEMPLVPLATAPFAAFAAYCGDADALGGMTSESLYANFASRIGDTAHARYTDAEAVAAMGALADSNPLHHNRPGPSEAVAAMGALADANPLNHSRYRDTEAVAAMGLLTDGNPLHHDRYTAGEAIAALAATNAYVTTSGDSTVDGNLTVNGTLVAPAGIDATNLSGDYALATAARPICYAGASAGLPAASSFSVIMRKVQTGVSVEQTCQGINGGWHACGVAKSNYTGQNCVELDNNSYGYGYTSFVNASTFEAGRATSYTACDDTNAVVCCATHCVGW